MCRGSVRVRAVAETNVTHTPNSNDETNLKVMRPITFLCISLFR